MPGLMSKLRYVVVDELHAFIGSERGKQLQSLMCRLERAVGRRLPRVACRRHSGIWAWLPSSCAQTIQTSSI
jgi:superfamily II helicase